MTSETVQVRLSGLDPADNLELQKSIREYELSPEKGVTMTLDRPSGADQKHGEPGTLIFVLTVVHTVAPTVLGLLSLWLEWRRGRSAAECPKPVTVEVTLPSGEQVTMDVDPSEGGSSSSDAEMLLKVAEKLAGSAAE